MHSSDRAFNTTKTILSLALITLAFSVIQSGYAMGQNPREVPPGTIAMWNEAVPVVNGWYALDGSDPDYGSALIGLFIKKT